MVMLRFFKLFDLIAKFRLLNFYLVLKGFVYILESGEFLQGNAFVLKFVLDCCELLFELRFFLLVFFLNVLESLILFAQIIVMLKLHRLKIFLHVSNLRIKSSYYRLLRFVFLRIRLQMSLKLKQCLIVKIFRIEYFD